jgi:transcriptional regulator with XRE-family HTH domain
VDTKELLRRLGSRVRALREQRAWSQEDLARRADRHFTYIGRIERGEQNVTVEVLLEISAALETRPEDLLAEEHPLLAQWRVTAADVVEAVSHGFRAQVDVKGKLAELMLYRELSNLRQANRIKRVEWHDADGKPDFTLQIGDKTVVVECKNVRSLTPNASPSSPIKVELQKTRNSKDGTPTRGYSVDHFQVLSACLFNRTGQWRFLHIASRQLSRRPNDPQRLLIMQLVPAAAADSWRDNILDAIKDARQ